jgi:large subunit ribosomal protein L25
MKTIEVKAQNRTGLGKSQTKNIRKGGLIPCIVYGNGETLHFSTEPLEIRDLIYTNEFRKANINLDGKSVECIIKDVQYHPVSDAILHVDFQTLTPGKAVKVNLPIRLVGTSEGQKVGGTLVQKMRKLQVFAKPESLSETINVDITSLELGKSLRVRDIKLSEGVEAITNGSIPVASIDIPRALRSAQTKAANEGKKK